MSDFAELIIDATWDGQPIPRHLHHILRLLRGPWDPELWFGTAPLDSVLAASGDDDLEIGEPGLYLRLESPFHDDPPPPGPVGPTPELWHHEVVELFLAGEARPTKDGASPGPAPVPYCELEMCPWGHYLFLRFEGVRDVVQEALPLPYRARRGHEIWWGEAFIPQRWLPPPPHRINAFAINGQGDQRRYHAVTPVPGPDPDFHQPQLFPSIELPGVDETDDPSRP